MSTAQFRKEGAAITGFPRPSHAVAMEWSRGRAKGRLMGGAPPEAAGASVR